MRGEQNFLFLVGRVIDYGDQKKKCRFLGINHANFDGVREWRRGSWLLLRRISINKFEKRGKLYSYQNLNDTNLSGVLSILVVFLSNIVFK